MPTTGVENVSNVVLENTSHSCFRDREAAVLEAMRSFLTS